MNRRKFLQAGTRAVSGMLLASSRVAFGYQANSAVRHALLGCGNRGSSVAESFARNDPYVINGLVTHWEVRRWNTVVGATAANPVR